MDRPANVSELVREIEQFRPEAPPALGWALPALREVVGAQRALTYLPVRDGETLRLESSEWSGFTQPKQWLVEQLSRPLRSASAWGAYDVSAPQEYQRNRAFAMAPIVDIDHAHLRDLGVTGAAADATLQRLRLLRSSYAVVGLDRDHQLRALVCDGSNLLSWVGCFQPEPFRADQVAAFSRVIEALRTRLKLERRVDRAQLAKQGLAAVLERFGRPAYLVDARGQLLHANTSGIALHDADPRALRATLDAAIKGDPSSEVELVPLGGKPPSWMAILAERDAATARLKAFSSQWGLTPRQTDVMRELARGESNREIAAALGCSERTVELHVTAILQKVGADSRSAAVATFWAQT